TASPAELERSYHEVAHCASTDFGLIDGWIPKLVAASDPCPIALGLGWRMPTSEELLGLTVDDRKAVAGALFDPGEGNAFGGLLLYARAPGGDATLVTLSPNAAEQPPSLDEEKRARPFFGAAVRCVSDSTAARHGPPPVLPGAGQCLRAQRQARGLLTAQPRYQRAAEVQNLKLWLDRAERTPAHLRDAGQLQTLTELLATPTVERIAREAREERALTERYADLAESIDDPGVSAAERERRHAEFDSMRKRLSGQIVQNAEGAGADRTALAALLTRAELMLETTAQTKTKASKKPRIDYTPLLARLRALSGKTAP
ncbi:MAG TPA: hypothetical protein VEQ59_07090, partial [Polyangiaceae bacterium]|nr:hypothetical protein [Polyangiaceae bacterium]